MQAEDEDDNDDTGHTTSKMDIPADDTCDTNTSNIRNRTATVKETVPKMTPKMVKNRSKIAQI